MLFSVFYIINSGSILMLMIRKWALWVVAKSSLYSIFMPPGACMELHDIHPLCRFFVPFSASSCFCIYWQCLNAIIKVIKIFIFLSTVQECALLATGNENDNRLSAIKTCVGVVDRYQWQLLLLIWRKKILSCFSSHYQWYDMYTHPSWDCHCLLTFLGVMVLES